MAWLDVAAANSAAAGVANNVYSEANMITAVIKCENINNEEVMVMIATMYVNVVTSIKQQCY